jgi:hypothetical protein
MDAEQNNAGSEEKTPRTFVRELPLTAKEVWLLLAQEECGRGVPPKPLLAQRINLWGED